MNTIPFASQKTNAITFLAAETAVATFGGVEAVHPTLILSDETVKKPGLVCLKKQPGLLLTGSAWSAFGQASNDAAPIMRKPSRFLINVQNVLSFLKGVAHSIGYLIYS